MPNSFVETNEGVLLIASGFDPVLRWDGLTEDAEKAGVPAPTAKVTLAGSGTGAIVGTYTAYLRYVNRSGLYSNLSPVSAELEVGGSSGTITGATNAIPIVITTDGAHGLTTGDTIKISGVLGNTAANDTWTITVLSTTTFSLDDSDGNATYVGGGEWFRGVEKILYSGVEVPTDPRVTRRQILRNTDGQADTYYVDIDTQDLSSTTFESTKTDDELADEEAQAILDTDATALANRHGVPPDTKAFMANHLNRMFYGGEVQYKEGNVAVTYGSATVTGIGTEWTEVLPGRFLWVSGATKAYEIDTVDVANQTLTLTEAYTDTTQPFVEYAIRPVTSQRKIVAYSEAGEPESVPATNAVSIPEDGDEITGLMPKGSFLYILERRHLYRFTFQEDPAKDGLIFLASNRGCINHRCWAVVEGVAYLLDEAGVHRYGGGADAESISQAIQDLFEAEGEGTDLRINWDASDNFHCVYYPGEDTIRWFVAFTGSYLPRHCLTWDLRGQSWAVEEFAVPIGASAKQIWNSEPRVFLGGPGRSVYLYDYGQLDGPDPSAGTVRGTVTAATWTSISDSLAAFASSGLVGSPISIVSGTGKGQRRLIASVSGTRINVTQPWAKLPDTTSVYQIGGIHYQFRTGWFRFVDVETENPRRLEIVFQPTDTDALMNVQMYLDHAKTARVWGETISSAYGDGVASTQDEADLVLDLTKSDGVLQQYFSSGKERRVHGRRFVSFGMDGVKGKDPVEIYEMTIDGVQ